MGIQDDAKRQIINGWLVALSEKSKAVATSSWDDGYKNGVPWCESATATGLAAPLCASDKTGRKAVESQRRQH